MKLKKRYRLLLILAFLTLSWLIFDYSTWTTIPNPDTLPSQIGYQNPNYSKEIALAQDYLKSIPKTLNVPSVSVAVGIANKIIWAEAIGYADVKAKKEANTKTIYRIGSSSKSVTATGIALLVDQGKLNLNDSVSHLFTNFPKKQWDFTPQQLLSHTAGLGNYKDFKLYGNHITLCNCYQFDDVEESLNVFNNVDLLFKPGSDFKYSTFDTVLLSSLIEKVSGDDFIPFMQNNIFKPLGMNHTHADHYKGKQPKTLATFYQTKSNKYREWRTMGIYNNDINLSYKIAGGGFLSTPTDLVKLGNAVLNDSSFISTSTRNKFFTPQVLNTGEVNVQKYALGWRSYKTYKNEDILKGEKAVWMVHHGGVSKGSMNFLVLFPDYNMVINASINARAEQFGYFWKEVLKLANIFISSIETSNKQEIENN